jgi:hypothetical protein
MGETHALRYHAARVELSVASTSGQRVSSDWANPICVGASLSTTQLLVCGVVSCDKNKLRDQQLGVHYLHAGGRARKDIDGLRGA